MAHNVLVYWIDYKMTFIVIARELCYLIGFYDTTVYFVDDRKQVVEVNSVELVEKKSAECLRELCRDIGLKYKRLVLILLWRWIYPCVLSRAAYSNC